MLYLSILFFSLSFLLPYHFLPLPLFYQNSLIFFAILFLLGSLKEIKIDQTSIIMIILTLIIISLEYIINKNFSDSFIYFLITLVFVLIAYVLGYNYRKKTKEIKKFIFSFLVVCCFLFIVQIIQFFQINIYFVKEIYSLNTRLYSNIGQPNILSSIYAIAIFILMQKNKLLNYVLIFIFVFGIYLAKSRVGYLSIFLIGLLHLINAKNIKILLVFESLYPILILNTIFFINGCINKNFSSTNRLENFSNGRIEIYKDAINLIKDNYLIGYGWESAYKYIPNNNIVFFKSPLYSYHNIIFDLILSYGVILTSIIVCLILLILFKNIKNNLTIYFAFSPFLLHSFLEFPYYYWYLLMPFIFMVGYVNKNFFNREVLLVNRNFLLIFILLFIIFYNIFYKEYEEISRPYLSAYYGECSPVSRKYFIFFSDKKKYIDYYCTVIYDKKEKEKIILETLSPNLLNHYLNTYNFPNNELKKYGCIKYNYSCNNNLKFK